MLKNKNALIIGGTASIADTIVQHLDNNYNVDLTSSYIKKINEYDLHKYKNVKWFELDLHSYDSLLDFINKIPNEHYSIVVILSMNSPGNFFNNTVDELKNFYSNYLVNNMLLGKFLLEKITNTGKIIYLSSIASAKPVPQINYSTVKGALQSFYTSLSTHSKTNQSIFSIMPGLIYDTPAFDKVKDFDSSYDIQLLATKEEIANLIINSGINENGKIIRLGKDA